jgi:site-specific DNA-methyltransferase (adenine-specific)
VAEFNIWKANCIDVMDRMIEEGITVDMILTSPPYDNMTTYGKTLDGTNWNFDVFKEIAKRMEKVLRPGGVICWVVGDQVKNGCKSGTTARQALYFMDELKMKWNDTIIYEKNSSAFPASKTSKRWTNIYESILVFTKGKIRDDIQLLCDKENKWAGFTNWGSNTNYDKDGKLIKTEDIKAVPEFSKRTNIWKYTTACEKDKNKHPAVFPDAHHRPLRLFRRDPAELHRCDEKYHFQSSAPRAHIALLRNHGLVRFRVRLPDAPERRCFEPVPRASVPTRCDFPREPHALNRNVTAQTIVTRRLPAHNFQASAYQHLPTVKRPGTPYSSIS